MKKLQSYTTSSLPDCPVRKELFSVQMKNEFLEIILLGFALETISSLKYSVGGVMEFLECEDNEFLLSFYTQNHFKPY